MPGCLLIVAASGYGKTTALESAGATLLHTASELLAGLPELTPGDRGLAVDHLCGIPPRDQVRLARAVAPLADRVPITFAARRPPGPAVIAALPAPVTERGPADLALGPDTLVAVLRDEHGVEDADLAYPVHELTAGWPALVHLAGDALGRHGVGGRDLPAALTEPGTAGATWIREQVLAHLPPPATRLLDVCVDLDPVSAPLCEALAPARSVDALRWLTRTGLLVAHPRRGPGPRTYRLVPMLAAVLAHQRRRPARDRLRTAAAWYAANGHPLAAARALGRAGDLPVPLIEARGDEMLAAGGAADVVQVIEAVPEEQRTPRVRLVLGDALRMAGDVAGARRTFDPLVERARRDGRCEPGLAWRAAMLPYMRADYRGALDLLNLAAPAAGAPTVDDVLLAACRTTTLILLGATDEAAASAENALESAAATGDDRAAAAAHIAAASTTAGARRDQHLAEALAAAVRSGDVIGETRVLVYQADRLLSEARYPQALDVAARAVRAAELGAPPGMLVTALHNAGEALARLGRYDEAILRFERSMRISRRVGLNRTAAGLYGLGEVRRQLGRREQSRAAFEEAADLARATAELQILVPALAGLARLLLDGADADVAAARAAAEEAERAAPPSLASRALVARGWVALAEGDLALAQQRAADAVRAARAGRQADALAESLELAAAVNTEPAAARAALQEAASIWHRAGARPAEDQILVLLGRLPGADSAHRSAVRSATRRLLALGIQVADASQLLAGEATGVRISVLGRFDVVVGGRPVPLPAWRSRQARTLLKILVARRGRPVPRIELCETLWPDDEPQRTAHRLSVLLSAVRMVLDPVRLWPADHYVRADLAGVSLDVTRVSVDVEDLLRDAAHGTRLARDGDPEHAREILSEVDSTYHGDAFTDEPYEDWADGLREHARAVWLRALRELADLCLRAGDLDQAATSLVRLLVADAFDESAHRTLVDVLVRAGRHGEARRAFDRWTEAMRSIDAPTPDRDVLRSRAVVSSTRRR